MALDPSLSMLSMLEMVRRAGADVDADASCLLPANTRDACYRRGLLASYRVSRFGAKRFALTHAGMAALRVHGRRRRAVGIQLLVEHFTQDVETIIQEMHRR